MATTEAGPTETSTTDVKLDVYPVTVRGPLSTNRSQVVTFARMFVRDGKLYIAESRTKGRQVTEVSSYEMPEGTPTMRGSRSGSWGKWSWSSCGCSNSWNRHSPTQLIAMFESTMT